MKRRIASLVLILFLTVSNLPALTLPVSAAATGTDMDALTALGINTAEMPEGYDPYSTDNPYGKNTVELSPVYELYKIGLSAGVGSSSSYNTTGTLQNGANTEAHSTVYSNTLSSSLYGNETWTATTFGGILGSGTNATVAGGTTTAQGIYTLISTGTVADSSAANIPAIGYLKDAANASTDLGGSFKYALSSVAAGNFDNNTSGLAAQTAMVYTSDYSTTSGLYLRFGNAKSGTYGSTSKELLSTTKQIGNPGLTYEGKPVENFAEAPYQLQNYLQVTTGDWNGDGIDEVAVYIPEKGNSRIVVFALQLTNLDDLQTAYLDASKWSVVWTYYLREGDVVSNMVSLVSGDVNQDGTDDLAATWGYYYGPTQNLGSTAVVMFGAKGTAMFTVSQQFNLTYGSSNIVRASFDFGDMAGSDEEVLILCGQSDADLRAGNTKTRYVGLYSWNGTAFVSNVYQNFDLFDKDGSTYTWPAMAAHGDKFYSLPLCTANTGVISQGIGGGGDLLYFDSLIIEYTNNGLSIKEAWDNTGAMQQNTANCVEYTEYGAVAGDFTGRTGAGALVTMTQTLSASNQASASYTVTGSHQEPIISWNYYYQNWLYKLFDIRTWYPYISGYRTVTDSATVNVGYEKLTMGKAYMVAVDPAVDYYNRSPQDFSAAVCLANTDKDSSYMNYTGTHYYTYTDPKVLAVLASPPYFKDLIGRDDLSGGYSESTTSYSSTTGSGSGFNASATISLGAYVSFEQDIEVFGVKVASVEAEASFTANFTFETEKTSTLEQTVTYSATSGEDMVAFYSIPMEIYEYESYVADGQGGYKKVLTTVNIPHEAAIRLLSLEEYESIAKDYSILPAIADNVLTHTLGDPSSYPSGTDGYDVIAKYDGTPTAVGFSSTSGGSSISQEIAMSTETQTAFSASAAVEARAGAGAGGFTVGYIAGAEIGAGVVLISTDGNSFSGDMQNMPIEAQPFGYNMNWKIFCYKYSNGSTSFPVVSYIVSDVQSPSPLPENFEQDISSTTDSAITLQWSYDKLVAGFRLSRYYEFPDGSGSYEIAFVPFTDAVSLDSITGTYYFSYTDTNLSPYTEYLYQIQTVSATNPKQSIYSEPMSCRTKTRVGYPTFSYSGLNEFGQLPIFPDADSTLTVNVASPSAYSGLSYQWQKLIDGNWMSLSGKTTAVLTISNAGFADNASYRCRVNCIYYDNSTAANYYISAYSDVITTVYSKRTPTASTFTAAENITLGEGGKTLKGLTSAIELYSANTGHSAAPGGNVTFTVKGTDYYYSQTVGLATSDATKFLGGSEKYYSTASLSIPSLPEGVYTVNAYYSGSRIFKDMETQAGVLVVVGGGSANRLSLSSTNGGSAVTKFNYGDEIWPLTESISKDMSGAIQAEPIAGATYKLVDASGVSPIITVFTAGSPSPNIGSYTLQAFVGSDLVAQQDFTVGKKQITVSVENKTNVSTSAVLENPPVIKCSDLTAEALAALNLTYTAINSAGNTTVLNNSTDPGKYTVTACTGPVTPVTLYNNYSVTYVSGTYVIIGATYRLTAVAAPYTDPSGTRPVGTIGISNTSQVYADYTSGTAVMLYATPKAGYQVDTWTAKFANNTTKTQPGGTTFSMTTEAQTVTVTVTFKPAVIRLFTIVEPSTGGSITCADEFFSSGAYVSYGAEYSFTALPEPGYHFSKWQTSSGGTTATSNGTPGPDGSNSLTVTVGSAPTTTVYAVFERDGYTLSLSGDITAYYMYDDDGNSTTEPVKKTIVSGSSVAGDTLVTVEPKIGYQAAAGAKFTVDGTATTDSSSITFAIQKNTTVSLATVRNIYSVSVTAENGSVASSVGGSSLSPEALASVPGGSSIDFTARADRGYIFDHWVLDGTALPDSTETLNISALGSNTQVTAVFSTNTEYTVNAAVNASNRGAMKYTLRDIYGDPVGAEDTEFPSGGLTVYRGESIILSVGVVTGSMMEQWKVNGINTYTTQKTFTIDPINENIDAVAYLKAASSYMVNFAAMGTTGSTLSASADGTGFTTGTMQFGGSALIFSAAPAAGYMLDYWTVTAGDLTAAEAGAFLDDAGNTMRNPGLIIDPLRQNLTVRAYYTALEDNTVTLPDTSVMGISAITYITPVLPADSGTCNSTTGNVRSGGTVRMTFTPNTSYSTSIEQIQTLLGAQVNADAVITATKEGNVYTATVVNLKQAFTLTEEQIFDRVYSITVPSRVTASAAGAREGDTVTLTVSPDSGYLLTGLTLDNGTLNETVSPATLTYTFVMPASNVAVSAVFTYLGGGGGTGGGSGTDGGGGGIIEGGGSGGPKESELVPIPSSGNGVSLNASVSVNDGIALLELDGDAMNQIRSVSGMLAFDLSAQENVTGFTIPAGTLNAISGTSGIGELHISLPGASITFNAAAIAAIGLSDSNVTLTAGMVDPNSLTIAQRALVGSKPVLDITLNAEGNILSDFGTGSVKVAVPYTLGPDEDPNSVVVWYLNDSGILETVTGKYNASNRCVVFTTDHFSKYVIGTIPFGDVSREKWYFDSVSFAYANGLFSGIEETVFAPEASITRAMLVTVLWRMEGKPDSGSSDFTDVGNGEWYSAAIAWAANNKIVAGYGNKLFGTHNKITREQMALILRNYAVYKGYNVSASANLSPFADSDKISSWAKDALQWANAEGYIAGTDSGMLDPKGSAARCQVAAILQRFITDSILKYR